MQYHWTTQDELDFLRGLRDKGEIKKLETCLRLAPYRVWYGPGMDVDPVQMIETLREMIADMKKGKVKAASAGGMK
jgi:hypothetical protein